MKTEPKALQIQAADAYQRVIADPATHGPEATRLVALARADRDVKSLVLALRAEGWFERLQLRHARALELLNEAARTARRHSLAPQLAEVLTSRGAVYQELGRLAAAQRDFDRASAIFAPVLDVGLAVQQAALHQNAGRSSAAAELYDKILADPASPPVARAQAANNLGMIHAQSGRYDAALVSFAIALETAQEVGPAAVAMATEGLAWGTVQAGRIVDGLALFDDATRLWTAAGLPLDELYSENADALADLRRLLPEATDLARRALDSLDRHGLHLMAAEAQLRCARLAAMRGKVAEAIAAAEAAANRLQAQGRASWAARARMVAVGARLLASESRPSDLTVARRAADVLERAGMSATAVEAHLTVGRVADALGRTPTAVSSWGRAVELARRAPVLVRLRGQLAAALAARTSGRPDAVLRHARVGLADLARHRAALASAELRALASGHGAELGSLGLATLVRNGSAAKALEWMERTRAAALATVEPAPVAGIEDELAALHQLQTEIRELRRQRQTEPTELLARQAAVEARIRRRTWTQVPAAPTPSGSPPVLELRRALAGTPLVEFDVLDGQVIAAVLERRRTRLVPLCTTGAIRHQLGWLLFALRRLTRVDLPPAAEAAARAMAESALDTLAELLIRPLRLPDHPAVVISPVGDLQRIPWAAMQDRPVSVVPSAALWMRTRVRRPPRGGRVALVAGPELPGALAEVGELRTLYSDPVVLVPPDSAVEEVTRALDGAVLAHLACHGLIRHDNPTFSSLLLSDGQLTLHELDRWATPPHRLALAACRSGQDTTYEGNETLGFVGTLLTRGTAGLVASIVDVPDWNVTPLLHLLHVALRGGKTLAEALHAARAELDRADPASFVAWCAFTAYGAA